MNQETIRCAWSKFDEQYLSKIIPMAEELDGDSEEIDAIISLLHEMKDYSEKQQKSQSNL